MQPEWGDMATRPPEPTPVAHLTELLRATPFGGLGKEGAARLAALFVARHVDRGEIVLLEGERDGRFIVVSDGRLKAFRSLAGGREITVFVLDPGDFFGFLPLLDGRPFPVSVAALEPSQIFVLTREHFERAARHEPELCLLLLDHVARRLRECLDQVGMMGHQGAVARAAHGLLSLAPEDHRQAGAVEVELPFSQAELARLLDVTPENLSRALTHLRRRGVVARLGRGRFRILDVGKLEELADGR